MLALVEFRAPGGAPDEADFVAVEPGTLADYVVRVGESGVAPLTGRVTPGGLAWWRSRSADDRPVRTYRRVPESVGFHYEELV